ncbi:DUF1906 domain-containing protein [Streptomyces sp. NPDC017940]|uniref:DUF1906 domain-containing protein n=1 Tax=Streptomyces sp. NPDC017940 TaxID=3365017 RepID=UPI00379BD34E
MRHRKMLLGTVLALAAGTLAMDTTTPADADADAVVVGAADVGLADVGLADVGLADAGSAAAPGAGSPAAGSPGAGAAARPGATAGRNHAAPDTFYGRAFDTCQAPAVDTMRRWLASDYGAVGVYFGGRGRACADQKHLSREWLGSVDDMGWRVLPLYVGSQSPCVMAKNKQHVRIGDKPWEQGTREGADAVNKAEEMGIAPESPLYLDMEAYRYKQQDCAKTTLSFVRAWNREVRRHNYVPGFYSSANSGVTHMDEARREGVQDLPAVMWFARWHTTPDLNGEPALGRDAWQPHSRIHQYAGNVTERHGGRTITIDRNLVDAPVATLG